MFLRLVGCVIFVFTIVFFVFPAENKLRRGFIGECTLVLIFYNCLFGLLILFFRIRRIQMVHQFIQIYLKIGVFFVQTVLSTVIRIVRVQIVLFFPFVRYAISVSIEWGRFGFIFRPASYVYWLVNHSIGTSMRTFISIVSFAGFFYDSLVYNITAVRGSGKLKYIFIGFLCRLQ